MIFPLGAPALRLAGANTSYPFYRVGIYANAAGKAGNGGLNAFLVRPVTQLAQRPLR